ncbi:MAG: UDP-N-acetylmuramate--L-alanine ligase [Candidatus Fonsibacter sp.]
MSLKISSGDVIHFIGIGGIGMSGIAEIMQKIGFKVQGSDQTKDNKNIFRLKKLGIKIFFNHKSSNIFKSKLVVFSSAIKKNNSELLEAKNLGIPIVPRVEMLAEIVKLKKNIVISGAHGKTTITSLISSILSKAKFDPMIVNGGIINSINTNAKLGKGEWAVVEADESDGSFLKIPITYSIVSNIDKEHLDFYKSFKNISKNFADFINKTPLIGKSFLCMDDKNIRDIIPFIKNKNFITYGFHPNSKIRCFQKKTKSQYNIFDVILNINEKKIYLRNIELNLLGRHNIQNATVAVAVAVSLGISKNIIKNSLKKFRGVQRRLTMLTKFKNSIIYDDYAHHPTEIKAVLDALKSKYENKKIITVFQPHRYSRVKSLLKEFSLCFKKSDLVVLCPIYAASEKSIKNINQSNLANIISSQSSVHVIKIMNIHDLENFILKTAHQDQVIVCMGAGSISSWIREIVKRTTKLYN